jgi:transposase-like protein
VVEQTLGNWVREHRAGTLKGAGSKPQVSAEQMENSRRGAELARVTMERDILHPTDEDLSVGTPVWEKRRRSSRRASDEVRLY